MTFDKILIERVEKWLECTSLPILYTVHLSVPHLQNILLLFNQNNIVLTPIKYYLLSFEIKKMSFCHEDIRAFAACPDPRE